MVSNVVEIYFAILGYNIQSNSNDNTDSAHESAVNNILVYLLIPKLS